MKKKLKKIGSGGPHGPFYVARQAISTRLKITFGALVTKYFKIQKRSEKNAPLDDIYLEGHYICPIYGFPTYTCPTYIFPIYICPICNKNQHMSHM